MADVGDEAQKLADLAHRAALSKIEKLPTDDGSEDCVDCGEIIGARRKAALPSARRCVDCQKQLES